jgi:hypothetical protein
VTECCANEVGPLQLNSVVTFGAPFEEQVPDRNLLENLLLGHSGLVDITSSSHNEFSAPLTFSDSLKAGMGAVANFDLCDKNRDGFVSWGEFFPIIKRGTDELYQERRAQVLVALKTRLAGRIDPDEKQNLQNKLQEWTNQKNQLPYAFSLGSAPREVERELFASNFGFSFSILPRDFGCVARLTRTPDPNTPAGRIRLQAGDIVETLDNLPIWGPSDVYGHHLDTKVQFFREGRTETRVADLPVETPFPPDVPRELYSQKFLTSYQLMPFGKACGMRISRMLARTSPLAAASPNIEVGDVIVLIDGQRIASAQDVESHFRETEIIFLSVRTNLPRRAVVKLP